MYPGIYPGLAQGKENSLEYYDIKVTYHHPNNKIYCRSFILLAIHCNNGILGIEYEEGQYRINKYN